jgi:RHS repeat-associated protein
VARLVATDYAAKVYTDVAPLDGADGKITAGDAWISQQAGNGALSLPLTPTAVDRLLLSGARRILYESVPTTVYFTHDKLDSLTVETDDQGAVVGRRAFSTFGAERASTGDGDSYGFTGQRADDSGTVHFSFRQLDPTTGRWASTDPLFHVATPDGLHAFGEATTAYAYVANNPANHLDPTGLGGKGSKVARTIARDDENFAKALDSTKEVVKRVVNGQQQNQRRDENEPKGVRPENDDRTAIGPAPPPPADRPHGQAPPAWELSRARLSPAAQRIYDLQQAQNRAADQAAAARAPAARNATAAPAQPANADAR